MASRIFPRGLVIVSMVLFVLLVFPPGSVLGGSDGFSNTWLEGHGPAQVMASERSGLGSFNTGDFAARPLSWSRKLLARSPVKATRVEEQRAPQSMSTVLPSENSTPASSTTPIPSARFLFASRFSSFFRSLAKGSGTPAPGTPSPGHN